MRTALVDHFGPWVDGWQWTYGEGRGGGVVTSWCCPGRSVATLGAMRARVSEAVVEWREWLSELAGRFAELTPSGVTADDRRLDWEKAVRQIVMLTADRTASQAGWYGTTKVVLAWFLEYAGVQADREAMIEDAVGGRFRSWQVAKRVTIDEVAEDLADRLP